jgi:death-on-curing protein
MDGNKRIGILAMLTYLELNGMTINCTDEEIIEIGYALAEDKVSIEVLTAWILDHKIKTVYK